MHLEENILYPSSHQKVPRLKRVQTYLGAELRALGGTAGEVDF